MQRKKLSVPEQLVQSIWLKNHELVKEIHDKLSRQDENNASRPITLDEFEALSEADKKQIYRFVNGSTGCPACREGLTVCIQKMDPEGRSAARSDSLTKPVTWGVFIKNAPLLLQEHLVEYSELIELMRQMPSMPAPNLTSKERAASDLTRVIPLNTINIYNQFGILPQEKLQTIPEKSVLPAPVEQQTAYSFSPSVLEEKQVNTADDPELESTALRFNG